MDVSNDNTCDGFATSTSTVSPFSSVRNIEIHSNDHDQLLSEMTVLDGRYFQYLPEKSNPGSNTVVARCMKCQPENVEIKGYGKTTSNFISHLKRRHGKKTAEEYKQFVSSKKLKPNVGTKTSSNMSGRRPGHVTLAQSTLSQGMFDEDIAKFVIHSMIPLRVIEDPYFTSLFQHLKISEQGLSLMSRRSLSRRIDTLYDQHCSQLKEEIQKISFVCTTADIWSAKKRSFLGVTVHWIALDFQRKSAALACRRFPSTHSFERIADLLHSIHAEYDLTQAKITATITDNGSNFVKAFKVFGVQLEHITSTEEGYGENESDEEDLVESESHLVPELQKILPAHLRCCAHTLSLCATSDVTKVLQSTPALSALHNQVMQKCNSLWKAAARPKTAETIEHILGHTLSRPGETRWNSLYDSLKQIVSAHSKCSQLFKALNIKNALHEPEFKYLEEHLACAQPVAEALDLLQGENNTYYGVVLPCLVSLRRKLQILANKDWIYCKPLSESFLNSVETRFNEFFNISTPAAEHAAIAAFSYPRFKNRWLLCIDSVHHERLLAAFKNAVAKEIDAEEMSQKNDIVSMMDDFFDFGTTMSTSEQSTGVASKVELQVLHFFDDGGTHFDILINYPGIKKVFFKYNTPLPSSAPVERLFSFATMTNTPKSHKLSDFMFEKRVVLKSNLK